MEGPSQQTRSLGSSGRKREGPRDHDDDTRLVVYRVIPTAGSVKEEDVSIYIATNPSLNVTVNFVMSSTVPSPLGHILTDDKKFRTGTARS